MLADPKEVLVLVDSDNSKVPQCTCGVIVQPASWRSSIRWSGLLASLTRASQQHQLHLPFGF